MKATLSHIKPRNVVKYNKQTGVMNNGIDNAYPTRMERIILSSVTAKAAATMYANFLVGEGFKDDINNIVIGTVNYKDITVYDLLQHVANSIAIQNGVFIHTNWGVDSIDKYKITDITPIPFKNARLGEQDDADYSGKIALYNNWDRSLSNRIMKDSVSKIDVFNPRTAVITSQVQEAGEWSKYKGQVYWSFFDNAYDYPLSPIDSAQDDADTEYQISLFKNGELRRNFFAKYILRHSYFENDSDKESFVDSIQEFQGGENNGSIMIVEDDITQDETGEVIDNGLKFEKVEQNINDKLFVQWETSIANNIRKSYKAIPTVLIEYVEGKLGGTSGEALTQAAKFYNQMTKNDRAKISNIFKDIFKHFHIEINSTFEIEELNFASEEVSVDIADQKRIESQANLKGSVGGVTALLQLQTAVAEGTADRSAAIEIVKEIYGFDEITAAKMIGSPDPAITE